MKLIVLMWVFDFRTFVHVCMRDADASILMLEKEVRRDTCLVFFTREAKWWHTTLSDNTSSLDRKREIELATHNKSTI